MEGEIEGGHRSITMAAACLLPIELSSSRPCERRHDEQRERERMMAEEGSEIEKRPGCLLRGRRGREGSAGKRGNVGKRKHFLGATSCGAGNPSLSELIYV